MRTIDKHRVLKLTRENGQWYVNCGKSSTQHSVHRLVGYYDNHLDLDIKLPLSSRMSYFWFVAHDDGSYQLYTVSFIPSSVDTTSINVFLGSDVSKESSDITQIANDMYNKRVGW